MICDCFHVFPSKREVFSLKDAILFWCCLPNVKSNFQLAKWRKKNIPFSDRFKIRQSTIWYAGSLGRWDKRLVDQASDVPSILCKTPFNLFYHFFYKITKMKIKSFECPKSIKNWGKKIIGTSDAWSMSHLSHWLSKPAYYLVDCRILVNFDDLWLMSEAPYPMSTKNELWNSNFDIKWIPFWYNIQKILLDERLFYQK